MDSDQHHNHYERHILPLNDRFSLKKYFSIRLGSNQQPPGPKPDMQPITPRIFYYFLGIFFNLIPLRIIFTFIKIYFWNDIIYNFYYKIKFHALQVTSFTFIYHNIANRIIVNSKLNRIVDMHSNKASLVSQICSLCASHTSLNPPTHIHTHTLTYL